MEKNTTDMSVCSCCGQQRPYPTQAGLWEYIDHPLFNPDGTLLTEFRGEIRTSVKDGKKLDNPIVEKYVRKHDQPWQRVSIVDVSHVKGMECRFLMVPAGKVHASWWPEKAMWRKVGDKPDIDWHDVVVDSIRLGDGKRVYEKDEEDED